MKIFLDPVMANGAEASVRSAAGESRRYDHDPARIQFHTNMAMIGGLLLAALDQP
ncbi:MAG: hypothetical protein JWL68_582 [Actinomycetia bacterium]|nr:hypothetical protein [Actinomycetes bacterium]